MAKCNITLIEGDNIIFQDTDVANPLNAFFVNAVRRTLEINVPTECLNDVQGISDSVQEIYKSSKYFENL